MRTNPLIKKNKEKITIIINSIIDIIKNPHALVCNTAYFYRPNEKKMLLIYLYIFKLLINKNDYLEYKYNQYINKFSKKNNFNIKLISNIVANNELDLILKIKEKIKFIDYYYNKDEEKIYFNNKEYIDIKWFLSIMSLLLDNTKNKAPKEINICYTISSKNISKMSTKEEIDQFLNNFIYYNIKVQQTDNTKQIRENNILLIKNAAINYLKHLKQYKHGLENEDSYQLFHNLLITECHKEGFELFEEEKKLTTINEQELNRIKSYLEEEIYEQPLSKQIHIIENIVWQSSNDLTLLEHLNTSLDSLIDFITLLKEDKKNSYLKVKRNRNINDINILLLLIVNQFLLKFHTQEDDIDYSLIELNNIKPKYMNNICDPTEEEIKSKLKSYDMELIATKRNLENYKKERAKLNKEELGNDKYQKELERCVSVINRESIIIARLNSKISSLSRKYEEIKKEQLDKYNNLDLYNYNRSTIKHICNSIIGCNYYLKTNNKTSILSNIIIFEDYKKTDNSFYLEISFEELLKISNIAIINGILNQDDLPKLA